MYDQLFAENGRRRLQLRCSRHFFDHRPVSGFEQEEARPVGIGARERRGSRSETYLSQSLRVAEPCKIGVIELWSANWTKSEFKP